MKHPTYTELLVLRHGQSVADLAEPRVFEGRMDTPLSEAGLAEARLAAEWIAAKLPPQRIVSSPLLRAERTAEEVALQVGLDVEMDERLLERHNGALAGLTVSEAKEKGFLPSTGYLPHETAPGGETLVQFRARAETFWSRLLSQCKPGQRILVVSHGQMIGMLFRCFLKLPVNDQVQLVTGNTGLHCWRVDGECRRIVFTNSQVHLEADSRTLSLSKNDANSRKP